MKKANCDRCAHKRRKKDYVQQADCTLELDRKGCTKFVDNVEWRKYQEMMKGKV